MRALWDNARDDGVIRETAFDALFGARMAVFLPLPAPGIRLSPARKEASRLPCAARSFGSCGSILNEKPVRRQAQWSDLPEAARPTLEKLVNARLLSSRGEGADASSTSHTNRSSASGRVSRDGSARITAFKAWDRNLLDVVELAKRDDGDMLKGKALLEGERWLKDRPQDIEPDARAFILASAAARNRDARVKRRGSASRRAACWWRS